MISSMFLKVSIFKFLWDILSSVHHRTPRKNAWPLQEFGEESLHPGDLKPSLAKAMNAAWRAQSAFAMLANIWLIYA